MLPFRTLIIAFSIISGIFTSVSVFAYETIYDRLDGTGPSKKRVDVIEWEGNLEIHAYPRGSLTGLGAKLDEREKGKKVMVIGYHLKGVSDVLVRRAILGVPFNAKLKAFIDTTEKDFDKLALSNQELQKPWAPYQLKPAPAQWGPDGSKYDEDASPQYLGEMKTHKMPAVIESRSSRMPASARENGERHVHEREPNRAVRAPESVEPKKAQPKVQDNSGVQEYSW